MIYIKRLCFIILLIISILLGIVGTIIQLVTVPIWGTIYYVITGDDPVREDNFSIWKYSLKFMEWYGKNYGPENWEKLM